jgi:MtrB/PioB family decaheme-associated outer membrane protein
MFRNTILSLLLLALPAAVAAQEGGGRTLTGGVEVGGLLLDGAEESSKLNEYRDLGDGAELPRLWLDLFRPDGFFLELRGEDLTRDDRQVDLSTGRIGLWRLDLDWTQTPHLLSLDARSPYLDRGNGLLELASTVPITFKKLATAGPDAPGVLASDELIAAYLATNLRPVGLGTQRDRGSALVRYDGLANLDLGLRVTDERRDGSKVGYGPIGDRPPRTLNVQFAEPVDYRTQDVELSANYAGNRYNVGFSYLISEFENDIDTLTWRNLFATPAPSADFDAWDRAVSTYGRRPLAPDNRFHNARLTFGLDGPLAGRLNVNASFGTLEQNEDLLPYTFATSNLVDPALPRGTADAEMSTTLLQVAYALQPVDRMNLRLFYRYFDLDNETPEDDWWYVTSDTANLNGTRSYKNRRTSLAYEYDTQSFGVESQLRLGFWRSSLGLTLEREDIGRAYREADTSENRLRAQLRSRPNDWLSLRLGYLFGDRDAGGYDGFVTRQSYWYAPADAGTDQDNPKLTFSNHPDMRRFDVSDRVRHQVDLAATLAPADSWGLSATLRFRDDDYDSDVRPSQPLLGTGVADQAAFTPGDQLGLLDDKRRELTVDAFFNPSQRLNWNVFVSFEEADSLQRGLEFNENNKANPSAVATAELGPWTRASSQWTTDTEQRTTAAGLGLSFVAVPERVTLRFDASGSRADLDLDYRGFGVTNWDGTPFPDNHQFAFRTPPTVSIDQLTADASVELALTAALGLTVGYVYDKYELDDWAQEANTPWFESVGSEYLLRDTSRSHQWGNRLTNLGSYLAPSYSAHIGYVSFTYRF